MKIQINGETRDVPGGLTLAALLDLLELPLDRVAVERNREIARRADWSAIEIQDGDQLEVVQMVGGGKPAGTA